MNYKNILTQFQDKQIMVVGDIILDEYIWGDVHRISPEAPVPVIEICGERSGCGGAANVAQNIVSLGGNAELIGVVGKDRDGEQMLQMLNSIGIGTNDIIVDVLRHTSKKTRVIVQSDNTDSLQLPFNTNPNGEVPHQGQHLLRIDRETKHEITVLVRTAIINAFRSQLNNTDAIIFADYDKGVFSPILINELVKNANAHRIPIVVDPKHDNFWHYNGVTALTPNHKEAGDSNQQEITDESTLISIGYNILEKLSLQTLLITREEEGMSLFQRNSDCELTVNHIPPHAKDVVDVTGAGDTVVSVFTLALAAGADYYSAAILSSIAGGIVVGKMGCANVTPDELHKAIEKWI